MASNVVVIATDLRRATIKVTPSTYMVNVLEEACKKLHLNSDKYLLKNNKKLVDLSVPYRTSGLIAGAKLELIVKSGTPSPVSVALQLPAPDATLFPPDGRLTTQFPSDFTIWKIMRQFESTGPGQEKRLNLTARGVPVSDGAAGGSGSGQLYYEAPNINIMGRSLGTFEDYQKTLSQLGYNSGRVLLRISFNKTDKTLIQAVDSMKEYFKEEEATQAVDTPPATKEVESHTASREEDMPTAEEASPTTGNEATTEGNTTEPTIEESSSSNKMDVDLAPAAGASSSPQIFSAPSSATPAAARLVNDSDSDFTPTIAHAQIHQARLQANSHNRRLLSDKELEDQAASKAAKLDAITSVSIRVRFPDNTAAQWTFNPDDTGAHLHKSVRSVMADDTQVFKLVLPGDKKAIKDSMDAPSDKLVKGYKLSGRVLVNLVWDDSVPATVRGKPFLKSNVAQLAQEVIVPEIPQEPEEDTKDTSSQSFKPSKSTDSGRDDGGGKKLPRWLKLGKK